EVLPRRVDSYRVGTILGRVVCNAFRPSFGSIWSHQGELRTLPSHPGSGRRSFESNRRVSGRQHKGDGSKAPKASTPIKRGGQEAQGGESGSRSATRKDSCHSGG